MYQIFSFYLNLSFKHNVVDIYISLWTLPESVVSIYFLEVIDMLVREKRMLCPNIQSQSFQHITDVSNGVQTLYLPCNAP